MCRVWKTAYMEGGIQVEYKTIPTNKHCGILLCTNYYTNRFFFRNKNTSQNAISLYIKFSDILVVICPLLCIPSNQKAK